MKFLLRSVKSLDSGYIDMANNIVEITDVPKAQDYPIVSVGPLPGGDYVILALADIKGDVKAWSAIAPSQARELAEKIARAGHAAATHDTVYGMKPIAVEQMRTRLVVVIEHLLTSKIINKKLDNPRLVAEECVELMLTEAT